MQYKDVLKMCPFEVAPFILMKDKLVFEEYKRQAELLRLQTYYIVIPNIDQRKANINKPSDLIPYSWDEKKKFDLNLEEYTPEAFDELDKKYIKKG